MKKKVLIILICVSCISISFMLHWFIPSKYKALEITPIEAKQFLLSNHLIDDTDLGCDKDKVTRLTFIKNVMQIIGLTPDMLDCVSDHPPSHEDVLEYIQEFDVCAYINAASGTYRPAHNEYVSYDDSNTNILYGKKSIVIENYVYEGYKLEVVTKAKPYQKISVKEAVTLTTRCVAQSTPELNKTYLQGQQIGIISSKDTFYSLFGKKTLTYNDMYILLYRLANQPRYKYIDKLNHGLGSAVGYLDENRSMTYIQYRQNREY